MSGRSAARASKRRPVAGPPEQLPPGEHRSVMLDEVLAWLQPHAGGRYIDGTLGNGGHAAAILKACGPDGQLLGLDADPEALPVAQERLAAYGERAVIVNGNFREMAQAVQDRAFGPVNGILLDLGISSRQLDTGGRGISFRNDEPLDMRFDPTHGESAADFLNRADEEEIANVLYEFGEEHRSRRVARSIVRQREQAPLATTNDLIQAVEGALGPKRGRIHPATKSFQALRIAVNDELGALDAVLPMAASLLAPGGRLAVISFHSLEDRRVKQFFRAGGRPEAPLIELTRKPAVPSTEESERNPRARSAKLRVAERTSPGGHTS